MHHCPTQGHIQIGDDPECLVCGDHILPTEKLALTLPQLPPTVIARNLGEMLHPDDRARPGW